MYVMQSLPKHQQSLAGGIFNVVIRLGNTAVMGISTAVFSSVELTPEGLADPILKFTRTFQVSIAFAAASVLVSLFIRLGTQGNHPKEDGQEKSQSDKSTRVAVSAGESELEDKKQEP